MYIRIFLSVLLFILTFTTNIFALGDISLSHNTLFQMRVKGVPAGSSRESVYMVQASYLHDVGKGFKIGAVLGAGGTNDVKFKDLQNSKDGKKYRILLCSAMLGGSYNQSLGEKVSWNSKLFFGCSWVDFEQSLNSTYRFIREISCFTLELSTGVQYLFTKSFGVGVDVGYRYTSEIEPLKNIELDLSGVVGTFNLIYKL
jgi:hypothetical protein